MQTDQIQKDITEKVNDLIKLIESNITSDRVEAHREFLTAKDLFRNALTHANKAISFNDNIKK